MAMFYKAECQRFKCHDIYIEFFKALPVRGQAMLKKCSECTKLLPFEALD